MYGIGGKKCNSEYAICMPIRTPQSNGQSVCSCSMAKVGVTCENNNNKRYDDRVWLEPVECIVEHYGQVVTKPLEVADLREGDQVKVKRRAKKGKKL